MFFIFFIFIVFSQDLEKASKDLEKVQADLKNIETMIEEAMPLDFKPKYEAIKKEIAKDPKKFAEFILTKQNENLVAAKTDKERKQIEEEIKNLIKMKDLAYPKKLDGVKNKELSNGAKSKLKFSKKPFPEKEDLFEKISISYNLRWQTGILEADGVKPVLDGAKKITR